LINGLIFIKELDPHIQPNGKLKRKAIVKCECENEFETFLYSALKAKNPHCKECNNKIVGLKNTNHGLVKNPVYWIWSEIKRRCYNKNSKSYLNYGAKGITMQESWINDVKAFYDYVSNLKNFDVNNLGVGHGKLTIDRINTKNGYFEGNIRWVNQTIQNFNKDVQINNKTGYKGISERVYKSYQVQVRRFKKNHYIGTFKTIEEAIEKTEATIKFIEDNYNIITIRVKPTVRIMEHGKICIRTRIGF